MEKTYDPKKCEREIYQQWLPHLNERGPMRTIRRPTRKNGVRAGQRFVALMAPPNITGSLHMGHALENTIIDVLVRYHRMAGCNVTWLPGTDHASIATQNVVEKQLKKEGLTRHQIGREAFLKRCFKWRQQYGTIILDQFKRLGISPDWSRARFTMDPEYIRSVEQAFVDYYRKGLVYRASRTLNWCTRCGTGLSDLEIEWKEEPATLYYIKYGPLSVATTRPETKLGDTGLAVHPRDKRYASYVGKELSIESIGIDGDLETPTRATISIHVVADQAVDPAFGTGVVKVTPAHDVTDYEISQRHKLPLLQVIDQYGRMTEAAGKYQGLSVKEAREKITNHLRALGLIERQEPYQHRLAACYRCGTVLEPLPSTQWFVKMDELAQLAKRAVASKKVLLLPKRWEKPYFSWLNNIRDWCVSRQLWWGQRLPVYNCKREEITRYKIQDTNTRELKIENRESNERFVLALEPPRKCPFCKKCAMQRSEDVFDTWFSSALWPFAILYTKKEQQELYPADIVSSARDILHLWITRMIFSGLHFRKKAPFKTALIHPTILTKEGKRMSKSLGTGIDPLELIERYGADATRFGLIWQMMHQQDIRFDEDAIRAGQKLANKLWNATRFTISRLPEMKPRRGFSAADRNILREVREVKNAVEMHFSKYAFGQAARRLYNFFWRSFADVYIEQCKGETENNPVVLENVMREILTMFHPFMPFVTEALWQELYPPSQKATGVNPWMNAQRVSSEALAKEDMLRRVPPDETLWRCYGRKPVGLHNADQRGSEPLGSSRGRRRLTRTKRALSSTQKEDYTPPLLMLSSWSAPNETPHRTP